MMVTFAPIFAIPASLGFLMEAFPRETGILPWAAAVPNVCQCVLSLFVGELSDIFGRRRFLTSGDLFLIVGSTMASRASTAEMLIGGQVLNGIGISLSSLVLPLLAEYVPKRSRSVVGIARGLMIVATISSRLPLGKEP